MAIVIRCSGLCVLLLGLAGSAKDVAVRFDDTYSLVQALHPSKREDRKAEQVAKKQLQEQAATIIRRIPGFPPLLAGPAKDLVVPKLMELRRKSNFSTQTVMDGILAMDLLERNVSDLQVLAKTLSELSYVFGKAEIGAVASALYNASVLFPAIAKATPKLIELDRAAKVELVERLKPVLVSFNEDIQPHMKALGSDVRDVFNDTMSEIGPRAESLMPRALGIINQTIWDALAKLNADEEFSRLRRAVKLVLGSPA